MAYSDGKIIAPVSISDVQKCFGLPNTDLGALIDKANINMWAKYKPVIYRATDTTNFLNTDGKTWDASKKGWWMGVNGNYGLGYSGAMVSQASQSPSALQDAMSQLSLKYGNDKLNGWTYERPAGNSLAPYRLLDFLGYNHNVLTPYLDCVTGDVSASDSSTYMVTCSIRQAVNDDDETRDSLTPKDISGYDLTLGFAILKRNGTVYKAIAWTSGNIWQGLGIGNTNDDITSDGSSYVETHLKADSYYYVMPFLSSVVLKQPAPNRSAYPSSKVVLFTVPYTNLKLFSTKHRSTSQGKAKPLLKQQLLGNALYSLTPYFDSTAAGYSGGTLNNVEVWIVNETYIENKPISSTTRVYEKEYGSVNVPSKSVVNLDTIKIKLPLDHAWRLIIWADSESESFSIMQEVIE